jgi:hypothetical protein
VVVAGPDNASPQHIGLDMANLCLNSGADGAGQWPEFLGKPWRTPSATVQI